MSSFYATVDHVVARLSRDRLINISEDEPVEGGKTDISYTGIANELTRVEAEVTLRLSRFYIMPLKLTSVSTLDHVRQIVVDLAAYQCWLIINPTMTRDDLPAAVMDWQKNANTALERIIPTGKASAEAGRDIILEGETLAIIGASAGAPAFAISRFVPFGGTA